MSGRVSSMEEDSSDDLPYSQRPEWSDVTPIPQDDGPKPLAVIRYPPGFEEVHSYFRAIQVKNEFSERALKLTADVIEHNSANYTAWYYRRRCLKTLNSDLWEDLEFTGKWARDCPKNYQVWYHRRWLITEIVEHMRRDAPTVEEGEKKIRELGEKELDYHMDVMQVNDDYKNYNGWSHRQFIVHKFGLWQLEMPVVETLLVDDIRNNSAWNHRYTIVKNTTWPPAEEIKQREIRFTLKAIRKCANNESAWNYLSAWFGEGEGRAAWDTEPDVEALCNEVLSLAPNEESMCRFAIEALAQVHEARSEVKQAQEQYRLLQKVDQIRSKYWEWKVALLDGKSAA